MSIKTEIRKAQIVTFCFNIEVDKISKEVISVIEKSQKHKKLFCYFMKPRKTIVDWIKYKWLMFSLKKNT